MRPPARTLHPRPPGGGFAAAVLLVAVLLLVNGCGAGAAPPAAAGDLPDRLAAQVDAWRDRGGYPAAVAVVRRPGEAPWVHASGTATVGGRDRVRPATQFRVASVTKLFVATVVLQLVDDGALDLDAPAARLVGRWPFDRDVTVRQLLGHTAGLPDYGTPDFADGLVDERERVWHAGEVLAAAARHRPNFDPGERWEYSNTNYVVLGEVVEAVTGRPWHEELRQRILDPLGLDATYVAGLEPATGDGLVEVAYADLDNDGQVEDVEQGTWPALETSEGAAGAIVSTAPDVARFTGALFGGRLLPGALLREMVEPGPHGRRYDDYGLGVELRHPDLETLVWGHGGFLPGYRSVTWYVPSTRVTVTVLTNHSAADAADLAVLLLGHIGASPGEVSTSGVQTMGVGGRAPRWTGRRR